VGDEIFVSILRRFAIGQPEHGDQGSRFHLEPAVSAGNKLFPAYHSAGGVGCIPCAFFSACFQLQSRHSLLQAFTRRMRRARSCVSGLDRYGARDVRSNLRLLSWQWRYRRQGRFSPGRTDLTPDYVFQTITNGKRAGSLIMPAWGESLDKPTIQSLTAYIMSLQAKP